MKIFLLAFLGALLATPIGFLVTLEVSGLNPTTKNDEAPASTVNVPDVHTAQSEARTAETPFTGLTTAEPDEPTSRAPLNPVWTQEELDRTRRESARRMEEMHELFTSNGYEFKSTPPPDDMVVIEPEDPPESWPRGLTALEREYLEHGVSLTMRRAK